MSASLATGGWLGQRGALALAWPMPASRSLASS
jgi:hypothetical protein